VHLEPSLKLPHRDCKRRLIDHRYDWRYIGNKPCKECQRWTWLWKQTRCILLRCAGSQHRCSSPRAPSHHPIDHATHQPPTRQRFEQQQQLHSLLRCGDTAAALCTGNYHFFAAIANQYPQCVAKFFLPEDSLQLFYPESSRMMLTP
jgi:hypothetical protein